MIKLLINKDEPSSINETSFGGSPVKGINEEFNWPRCACCKGYMQFLGKLKTDIGLEQIFMCQNEPGLCEEWSPNDGGNQIIVTIESNLEYVTPPVGDNLVRDTHYGVTVVEFESNDYDEAREKWSSDNGVSPRQVLGQLLGKPSWIQGDETPVCNDCNSNMRFVAQIEQGPNWETEMNFGGGGCAYSFDCACNSKAKFLWQC